MQIVSHLCKILKLVFQAFANLNVVEFRFIFLLWFDTGIKYSIKNGVCPEFIDIL